MSIKAFLRSILLNKVTGPRLFMMAYASSTEQYVSVYASGSIKSVILLPKGADRY